MKLRKPNLFIVGAAKSGTTALYHFLKQHPDIFMSEKKELRFFCKDFIQANDKFCKKNKRYLKKPDFYPCRTEEDYLSFFEDWEDEKIAGEASPVYLESEVAANEIRKFNPAAKVVILIRNPVDRMYSVHSHALRTGVEVVKDFKKALALEEERKKGKHIPKFSFTNPPDARRYSERARVSEKVQRYLDFFGKKQVIITIFDDFKKDNPKVYREVLEFLGVDQNFVPKFKLVNVNREAPFPRLRLFLLYHPLMNSVSKRFLPVRLKRAYRKFRRFILDKVLVVKERPRPPMDPQLRRELMKKFKPEVERLSKIAGRDLITLWGYDTLE